MASQKESGETMESMPCSKPQTRSTAKSRQSTGVTQDAQSEASKIVEGQVKQESADWRGLLYNFPQQAFLLILFGLLAIGGSIAALVFKIDAPMFMPILYAVGGSCGFQIGAETYKHVKRQQKPKS